MASRVSSLSRISSVSSIGTRRVDAKDSKHSPTATTSASDPEEQREDQEAAADKVNNSRTPESLLQRKDSSQHEDQALDFGTGNPDETHDMQHDRKSWYHDWWCWEIAGALLSLVSTAAIIVILALYNHRPVPVLRYGITLNAMLSVLSTTAKTSMLLAVTASIGQAKWLLQRKDAQNLMGFNIIDKASRGPWGSLQLLCHFWDGKAVLASVGAFIVLVSLAVDPFTQQVLSYPVLPTVTNGYGQLKLPLVSSVNISEDSAAIKYTDNDPTSILPLALRAAVYNSILSLGTAKSTLKITCPSASNCTYDRSATLGFCSTCSNVTRAVRKNCERIPPTNTTHGTNCTFHLPGGVDIKAREKYISNYKLWAETQPRLCSKTTNMSVVALPLYENLYGNSPNANESRTLANGFQGVADPILGFGRIAFNSSSNPSSALGNFTPTAAQCALYWCVQTLDTSITNSSLHQTMSNKSALHPSGVADLQPPINVASNAATTTPPPIRYHVSPSFHIALVKFLQDTFNATVKGIDFPGADPIITKQETLDLVFFSSDIARALWFVDDLETLMINLADRMTDVLRNLYHDKSSDDAADADADADADVRGNNNSNINVYTSQPHVFVSWPWLTLPVGLVLASCGLLLATIAVSGRRCGNGKVGRGLF